MYYCGTHGWWREMMTKDEALKCLALIEYMYPVVLVNSEIVLKWISSCASLEYTFLYGNLIKHIRKEPYPPMLAKILNGTVDKETYFGWLEEYTIRDSKRGI
jgi:Leucine-rich repeat (LRR) protein